MEKEGQDGLKERFMRWGVTHVLFDMDGTLVDTHRHYIDRMQAYCRYLADESGGHKDKIFNMFMGGVIALREEFQVEPPVLEIPARVVAKMCGVEGLELESKIDELMMIYEMSPEVLTGAVEQVRRVRDAGVETALVTHAGEEWTVKKRLKFWGLFGDCVCTPTCEPKDTKAWRDSMVEMDLDPSEVMVVGDSWVSDIEPALELGVKRIVWISEDNSKELPEGVIRIEKIEDLVDSLLLIR